MHEHDETFNIQTRNGVAVLSIFEDGIPPVFRVHFESWSGEQPLASEVTVVTTRLSEQDHMKNCDRVLQNSLFKIEREAENS